MVQSMRKIRQDNNVTDRTGVAYAENEIKSSWPIELVRSMRKTRQDNDMTEWRGAFYIENDIELS